MTDSFSEDALTEDKMLGGRVRLLQPKSGYRAGVDSVLLAACVPARPGQHVLELGCGAGTALLCLATRVSGLHLAGVELQPGYAELAGRNIRRNGHVAEIVTSDLAHLPAALRQKSFDHVLANPPYFDRARSVAAGDGGRETALGQNTPLSIWIDVAARRLSPGGTASFIFRAERLPDLLSAMVARLGAIQVLPLVPRQGRDARLVIARGRKGSAAAFRLHAPIVMHTGDRHVADGDDYAPAVRAVLRDAAALPFPA